MLKSTKKRNKKNHLLEIDLNALIEKKARKYSNFKDTDFLCDKLCIVNTGGKSGHPYVEFP